MEHGVRMVWECKGSNHPSRARVTPNAQNDALFRDDWGRVSCEQALFWVSHKSSGAAKASSKPAKEHLFSRGFAACFRAACVQDPKREPACRLCTL